MGDIYYTSHASRQAELFFTQALNEVGNRDPKFTMRTYVNLAEMQSLKNPQLALEWLDKSESLAKELQNMEYQSMSVAMKAYVFFIKGDSEAFFRMYDEYERLRATGDPDFSRRFDNVITVARLSFEKDFKGALDRLYRGNLDVDSSLVAVRIFALQGDVDESFEAMKRRYVEMDSINSLSQGANYGYMTMERSLIQSQNEAATYKKKANTLKNWLIGLVIAFVIIYVMGRRRLVRIIWARNKNLKEALDRAEESDHMKSAFISNMSHEIRTPLNAVAGFSELLCNPEIEIGEEEKKDMQERISNNVELITSIVNEMLELSKSESESNLRPDSEMEDIWINQLCRRVLRLTVTKTNQGVETRYMTKVTDDFVFRSHGATITRILMHLLNNAQKFTEEGFIELRCVYDQESRRLNLMVTDTGIGIPEEDQDRIFDLFEKGSGNFKEGIGLGLPICRRLAQSIGAEVNIDKTYKTGCRFILSIPVKG
jgi:signal transduction histidine kinase